MVKNCYKLLKIGMQGEWMIFFCLRLYEIVPDRCKTPNCEMQEIL